MDIYCVKCGEPIDNDELHYIAEDDDRDYRTILRDFRVKGCVGLGAGYRCNTEPDTATDPVYGLTRSQASSALFDIMGDDVDGVMSEMQDLFG